MAKIHLNIEDRDDGQIAMQLIFGDGHTPFDPHSGAHQLGWLALKYLEALLEQHAQPEIEVTQQRMDQPAIEGPSFPALIEPSTGLVGRG